MKTDQNTPALRGPIVTESGQVIWSVRDMLTAEPRRRAVAILKERRAMGMSAHQSPASITTDWLTPPEWISVLGPFDLDPCASVMQPWTTAKLEWHEKGLDTPWDGLVWLNPPYGPPKIIEPWMARMSTHRHGIACIPARTETKCWFKYVWPAAELILFTQGRPHFHKPITGERAKANSGAPIALIAYGKTAAARLYASGINGWMVKP